MAADKFPCYSNMEFRSDNVYPIEESRAYSTLGEGVRSVEFIRMKGDRLLFVEARSSVANPQKSSESFEAQVKEIFEKFLHSLNLFSAIKMRVVEEDIPLIFHSQSKTFLVFVLVIRDHEPKWCVQVKRALMNHLNESVCIAKIWKPTVYVINHDIAKRRELVKSDTL